MKSVPEDWIDYWDILLSTMNKKCFYFHWNSPCDTFSSTRVHRGIFWRSFMTRETDSYYHFKKSFLSNIPFQTNKIFQSFPFSSALFSICSFEKEFVSLWQKSTRSYGWFFSIEERSEDQLSKKIISLDSIESYFSLSHENLQSLKISARVKKSIEENDCEIDSRFQHKYGHESNHHFFIDVNHLLMKRFDIWFSLKTRSITNVGWSQFSRFVHHVFLHLTLSPRVDFYWK